MKALWLLIFWMAFCVEAGLAQAQAGAHTQNGLKRPAVYDGNWWSQASPDEQGGFSSGASNCRESLARLDGDWGTDAIFIKAVTEYYQAHPEDRRRSVIGVWLKVRDQIQWPGAYAHAYGPGLSEVPRDYGANLSGMWYLTASYDERIGYLEGFLSCAPKYLNPRTSKYSRTPDYYDRRMMAYLEAHRLIATRLFAVVVIRRFRDPPVPAHDTENEY